MTAFTQIEGGGVTSALGFKAAGIHAGFRKEPERRDLALVVADEPCAAAGTCETTMWTCDFSHDYVTINGDYRT